MTLLGALLISATVLCSLVAGFLLAFALVVMPGIGKLDDRGFVRAFQVIDGVIQEGQPVFVLVWVSSVLTVVTAAVIGLWMLGGAQRLLILAAALVYVAGVQAPTFKINIPLNNALQRLDPETMDATAHKRAREDFETPWNRSNLFRTVCACVVSVLLAVLLVKM